MEEELIKRVPPHNIEAEQSVIGAMLVDKDALMIASEMLKKDDFYGQQYGILFEAMVELYTHGKPVDLVTLQNCLKEKNVPEEISGLEYIQEVISLLPTSSNIKSYAEIVSQKALMRRLIKAAKDIEDNCYSGKETTEYILEQAEKQIFDIVQRRNIGEYVPISEVVMNALEKINIASQMKGAITGLATGFTDLDYKTAGLQPSDLILIAARPSMGKTAFVLNLAEHICFRLNECACIFSLEMSKEQLVNRLISLESRVDSQKIRTGNMDSDEDWDSIAEAGGIIGSSKLIIDDTPSISISELRSKCRKYKIEHDLKIIIIDYLQLMSGNGKGDSRQQEISDISRSLKALARELNVPVIALSQLSRAVEKRDDHRPMLSDLRESGAIEQDADVVMFLYREDYYNKETERKHITEVIIAKQRNGPIGTVELVWMPDYTKFVNKLKD